MSRLNRKLRLEADRQRHPTRPDPLPVASVDEGWFPVWTATPSHRHYRLKVEFEQRVVFEENRRRSTMTPTLAVASARRGIIEAVFGEFREHFGRLHAALAVGDYDTLSQRLQEFESAMFDLSQDDGGTR